MPQSIPIAKHKPSRLDYLLFVPFILFCIAGLAGLFGFPSKTLLIAALIYGVLELSYLPLHIVLGSRAVAMLVMACVSAWPILIGGDVTTTSYLIALALLVFGLANTIFCFARLPQKKFDVPVIDHNWMKDIYAGEFFSGGDIRKIGEMAGVYGDHQPILLYQVQGKQVPFIIGRLTPLLESPDYTTYSMQMNSLGANLRTMNKNRGEYYPSYDRDIFAGDNHGYIFTSPEEKQEIIRSISDAMLHCSIIESGGKKHVFAEAHAEPRHSRIITLLKIEHCVDSMRKNVEREIYYRSLRYKLYIFARDVECQMKASLTNDSFARTMAEGRKRMMENVDESYRASKNWLKNNQANLNSSDAFLEAFSQAPPLVGLGDVISFLSKQQHPIIPKLLATLNDEREAFRQRIEAKQQA